MTEEKYDKKDVKNLNADKRAAARGLVMVLPKPNELFVDIDRAEDMTVFRKNLGWLEDLVTGFDVKPSHQPGHYHITVRLSRDVRDGYERIALQALLGSDRLREVLSWRNLVNDSGRPTVFFEKPPVPTIDQPPGELSLNSVVSNLPADVSENWRRMIMDLAKRLQQ